jgi:hypothetical protein
MKSITNQIFLPLECTELHCEPVLFVFASTISRFNADWAETKLSSTLSLDESGSVKIKNAPRVIVDAPWVP